MRGEPQSSGDKKHILYILFEGSPGHCDQVCCSNNRLNFSCADSHHVCLPWHRQVYNCCICGQIFVVHFSRPLRTKTQASLIRVTQRKNTWPSFWIVAMKVKVVHNILSLLVSALPTLSSRRASMMSVVNWWDLTIIINHGKVSQVSSLTVALGFPNPLETALTEAINFLAHQSSICMLFNLKTRHKPNVHCRCNRLPKHSSIKSK